MLAYIRRKWLKPRAYRTRYKSTEYYPIRYQSIIPPFIFRKHYFKDCRRRTECSWGRTGYSRTTEVKHFFCKTENRRVYLTINKTNHSFILQRSPYISIQRCHWNSIGLHSEHSLFYSISVPDTVLKYMSLSQPVYYNYNHHFDQLTFLHNEVDYTRITF